MTREQILNAKTIKTEPVDVPEWGGTFTMCGMNAAERVEFFTHYAPDDDTPDKPKLSATTLGVLLLIQSLRDADGNPVLRPEDAPLLEQGQDGRLINRLCVVANRVNGLDQDAKELAAKK